VTSQPATGIVAAVGALAGAAAAVLAVAVFGVGAQHQTRTVVVESHVATVAAASQTTPAPVVKGLVFDAPQVYAAAAPGVVTVNAVVGADSVSGSGFVVSATGDIITNAHVVTNSPTAANAAAVHTASNIYVRFGDGNQTPARVVGYDLFDDVALLRIDPTVEPLTVLVFDASRRLLVGDPVAVIGSPFGQQQAQSLSVGVVSALDREIQPPVVSFQTPGVIQTDAAINHGNSGGPLLDAAGRVVGVAAQIESTSGGGVGVGFAIPSEAVARSYREILRVGSVRYAWLGVATQPVTRTMAHQFGLAVDSGLLIDQVTAGGPAERAGLSPGTRTASFQNQGTIHPDGDVIVAFGSTPIRSASDLALAVALAQPGQRVVLGVIRRRQHTLVPVVLGERPTTLPA
jgi:S1-C subfamily serine protease